MVMREEIFSARATALLLHGNMWQQSCSTPESSAAHTVVVKGITHT